MFSNSHCNFIEFSCLPFYKLDAGEAFLMMLIFEPLNLIWNCNCNFIVFLILMIYELNEFNLEFDIPILLWILLILKMLLMEAVVVDGDSIVPIIHLLSSISVKLLTEIPIVFACSFPLHFHFILAPQMKIKKFVHWKNE